MDDRSQKTGDLVSNKTGSNVNSFLTADTITARAQSEHGEATSDARVNEESAQGRQHQQLLVTVVHSNGLQLTGKSKLTIINRKLFYYFFFIWVQCERNRILHSRAKIS